MKDAKLNIGCGRLKKQGYINLDISSEVDADIICDIRNGLPYKDNLFSEVNADCVLEQLDNKYQFLFVMNEIWRVLIPNGILSLTCPSAKFPCAFQDPWDNLRFTEETWSYLDENDQHYKQFGQHYGFKPWKNIQCKTNESGIMLVIIEA